MKLTETAYRAAKEEGRDYPNADDFFAAAEYLTHHPSHQLSTAALLLAAEYTLAGLSDSVAHGRIQAVTHGDLQATILTHRGQEVTVPLTVRA